MSHPTCQAIDMWIARESIPFDPVLSDSFDPAVDQMMSLVGPKVELLGIGEPMHGGEHFLILRNRLFARLVEAHGFSAIAVESSFPRGHVVNDYVGGCGTGSYDAIQDVGFSHNFGRAAGNRELVEWMRCRNADAGTAGVPGRQLHFYGFDSPTEMTHSDSPRRLLRFALDYMASIDPQSAGPRRQRMEELLGADADWENPAAMMDASKSVGISPAANALRIETEELIVELRRRRPEFVAASDEPRYLAAEHHAAQARHLLNYHAALARPSSPHQRLIEGLGIRDLMMADNLAYITARERGRGKVLAFAHNSHLKRGQMMWQLGSHALVWWPAGAQVTQMLGDRYAVIGAGVGVSSQHGIAQPETGTLEQRLAAAPGPARFIPTHLGHHLPAAEVSALPTRSGATANPTYFPFTPASISDFDWLAVLDAVPQD